MFSGGHCLESDTEADSAETYVAGRRAYEESKFMKLQESSLVAAAVAACLAVGCATTTGKTATEPPDSMHGAADAIIHVSGLSCPF